METPNIKKTASELQFWARRYAEGRMSVVCLEVNRLTEQLLLNGIECKPEMAGDRIGTIWAHDGDPLCCNAYYYKQKYGNDGKIKPPNLK